MNSIGAYMISSNPIKQSDSLKKGYQLLTKTNGLFNGHYLDNIHDLKNKCKLKSLDNQLYTV